ncbi:MAG: sugar-binding transcriptional regulator [Lactobacillus sp.]|jgi:DNA-binding transcriptional regulator LsrR (DeoR family)|nr:sugar-binding transcriptional regulator [Lactobacillus sp.]MCI2032456.1 sugar-binding transcriptional regulator [Lactobacillus sp.]
MASEQNLLTRVAYQYYILGQTQQEIAETLNLGRSTISRLLTRARQEGIISIKIAGADTELLALEAQLKERFGLRNVDLISTTTDMSEQDKETALAHESARYLKQIIRPNDHVGIAWGSILAKMVGQLDHPKTTNAIFVPLVGGPSAANAEYHVNTIVYDLARQFGGTSVYINAAAVQESRYLRDGIMHARYFQELANAWQHLDIAFVGVGGPLAKATNSHWRDLLTEADIMLLKEQKAIGDCCCTFFDQHGKLLAPSLRQRTIAIALSQLQKVPISVAVARSQNKVPSLKALLSMAIVNTLITDEETARALF